MADAGFGRKAFIDHSSRKLAATLGRIGPRSVPGNENATGFSLGQLCPQTHDVSVGLLLPLVVLHMVCAVRLMTVYVCHLPLSLIVIIKAGPVGFPFIVDPHLEAVAAFKKAAGFRSVAIQP
ncbi:hypothetical protein QFZ33_002155 [Arthrobacter globiformis]|nr:hypothetical protein [Arthrobacter globiformis]